MPLRANYNNDMNESETRAEYIDPALKAAGWGVADGSRIRREFPITPGRIEGQGPARQGAHGGLRAWSIATPSSPSSRPRRGRKHVYRGSGPGEKLCRKVGDSDYTYSSNGRGHLRRRHGERPEGESTARYPTPDELWHLAVRDGDRLAPPLRRRAISRTRAARGRSVSTRRLRSIACLEAIGRRRRVAGRLPDARHRHRQDVDRLPDRMGKPFNARWNLTDWKGGGEPTRRPRTPLPCRPEHPRRSGLQRLHVLRGVPGGRAGPDQAPEAITQEGHASRRTAACSSPSFQTFMSGPPKDGKPSPDFRGVSAGLLRLHRYRRVPSRGGRERRRQLARRSSVYLWPCGTAPGLRPRRKRQENADTYAYFGEPVYVYSLKEGINDGFLTPFTREADRHHAGRVCLRGRRQS